MPTKVLEYLSCGKPVVSTSLKGTVELLPNEDFGIVYAKPENFIQCIINLFSDENKMRQLGNNGYNYIQSNHDWKKLSDKLLKIFHLNFFQVFVYLK